MLGRTISNKKNLKSVATKVAIQMNCKLGGEAWALDIPVSLPYLCHNAWKASCNQCV